MSDTWSTVIVIAKRPLPGRVKTRLTPPFTPEQAAALAAAALHDTLAAADAVPAARHVLLFEGDPTGWVPAGWDVVEQVEGGLDARLTAGFVTVAGGGPAVLVGMDTPQITAADLPTLPEGTDSCLGLATDGGFWAIGFADPSRATAVIPDVPMSTDRTGVEQHRRLRAAHLTVLDLAVMTDVDDETTARSVAGLAPGSRFAGEMLRVTGRL